MDTFTDNGQAAAAVLSPTTPEGLSSDVASSSPEQDKAQMSKRASVKKWQEKIRKAKEHWKADFKRIRDNMEFATGIQWAGQVNLDSDQYVNNITLRNIQQKVSLLYARDPKATAVRRKRMDFQIWDEKEETLQQAVGAMMMVQQQTMAGVIAQPPMQAMAILHDYQQGKQWQDMVDKVCRTVEIVYGYQMESQEPEFKEQMKSLVRCAITAGVGFTRIHYCNTPSTPLNATATGDQLGDRARNAKAVLEEVTEDEGTEEANAKNEQLRLLANSLGAGVQAGEQDEIQEKLVWDFPQPTSIIVDPACKALKGFVNAKWIVQEYILAKDEVEAFFGCDLKLGVDGAKEYNEKGLTESDGAPTQTTSTGRDAEEARVCVWEVMEKGTKSHFFIVDGFKDYVQEPETMEPMTQRFWPVFALTFNDVSVEPGATKASIYPPSDVQLMRHAQKEWNRTREALREHRKANAPFYGAAKGVLSPSDKQKLTDAQPHQVIEFDSVPPGTDLSKIVVAFAHAPVDPALYDTHPLEQDILLGVGAQQENLGPTTNSSTATGQTIAENSRLSATASNVDDLDGFLSRMAKFGGEMLLRAMPVETVKRIAGQGAVWPTISRQDFLDALYLEIEAASSGRPNQALAISKWGQLAPVLQAAGANPQFMVRESIKRLDDQMDPDSAFPLIPTGGASGELPQAPENEPNMPGKTTPGGPQPQMPQGGGASAPVPQVHQLPNGHPVPTA